LKLFLASIYSSCLELTKSMTDFKQEIQRLQKLSCIALSPEEEKKL